MVDIANYEGREQAFIKHFFFKNYIETLFFRLANKFDNIVYVDGFSGPWQSKDDRFRDTSFGIALNAMQMVKAYSKAKGRQVSFTAHLVEENALAYAELSKIPSKYPELTVKTYHNDFLEVVGQISKEVKKDSFCFVFIDPKGWKIDLKKLSPLLSLKNSEAVFNFMFEFINRFVSHPDPAIIKGLDELFPYSENWREKVSPHQSSAERKDVIFDEFAKNLEHAGKFGFVAQTEILKPTKDRPLYALFFATRSEKGIEVFRHQQVKALEQQIKTRGETKMKDKQSRTGQGELFNSANELASTQTEDILRIQKTEAEAFILQQVPIKPNNILYENLRLETAKRFIVTFTDVNKICKRLRKDNFIETPDWEKGRQVLHPKYRVQKP